MEFKHITDCWNYLKESTTLEDLKNRVKDLPYWSGIWELENHNGYVSIINYYEEYGNYNYDIEDTDIQWEE